MEEEARGSECASHSSKVGRPVPPPAYSYYIDPLMMTYRQKNDWGIALFDAG